MTHFKFTMRTVLLVSGTLTHAAGCDITHDLGGNVDEDEQGTTFAADTEVDSANASASTGDSALEGDTEVDSSDPGASSGGAPFEGDTEVDSADAGASSSGDVFELCEEDEELLRWESNASLEAVGAESEFIATGVCEASLGGSIDGDADLTDLALTCVLAGGRDDEEFSDETFSFSYEIAHLADAAPAAFEAAIAEGEVRMLLALTSTNTGFNRIEALYPIDENEVDPIMLGIRGSSLTPTEEPWLGGLEIDPTNAECIVPSADPCAPIALALDVRYQGASTIFHGGQKDTLLVGELGYAISVERAREAREGCGDAQPNRDYRLAAIVTAG